MVEDIKKGNGFGFITKDKHICMEKCFQCGKENYAFTVMTGTCAWCGYDANQKEVEDNETI